MGAILSKIQNVINARLFKIDFGRAFDFAIVEGETLLLDLATDQLDRGTDQEGSNLGTYANIAYKGRLRPVDLKDTGAFRRSFDLKNRGKVLSVTASDEKTDKLQDKYGDDILGLPRPQWAEVKDIVKDGMIDAVRTQLR